MPALAAIIPNTYGGIGQAHVYNIDGCNCVCQAGGKQTNTSVISHRSGVDPTSHHCIECNKYEKNY